MKIILFEGGEEPLRKHYDDAGMDCFAAESMAIEPQKTVVIRLGFAIELCVGYELQVRGRSSLSAKGLLVHTGTVDAGYRGEIKVIITNLSRDTYQVEKGARIAQAVISSYVAEPLTVVDKLSETERGAGGFGSTGQ